MNRYMRGKWKAMLNGEGSYIIFTEKGRGRRRIHAECLTGDYGIAPHEAKANAVLIAHAPEMLDMLLDCAEFLEELEKMQCEGCSEYAGELDARIEALLLSIESMETEND